MVRREAAGPVRLLEDMAASLGSDAGSLRALSRTVEGAVDAAYEQGYTDGFGECARLMEKGERERAKR